MSVRHLNDAIFDFAAEIAWEIYEKRDSIYSDASEGLLDDDHELIDINATDIIQEMIKEKMNDR